MSQPVEFFNRLLWGQLPQPLSGPLQGRIDQQRLAIFGQRFVEVTLGGQHVGQVGVGRGRSGIGGDGRLELPHRLLGFAGLDQSEALFVQCLGQAPAGADPLPVDFDGLGEPALFA